MIWCVEDDASIRDIELYALRSAGLEAEGFTGGEVVIDHVENEAGAQALASRIVEHWPGSKTIIMPCNGLDSYYAEMHGLIIGYGMGVASGR